MGTLYVVATPIGNLEDITLRAIRILGEVGLIAAEDTRVTSRLLARHGIATPLTSYHQHNHRTKLPRLLDELAEKDVALVSDAGTPGVNDPGQELVEAAAAVGVEVITIPGPSAVTSAIAVSGLPVDGFVYLGFLPRKPMDRRRAIASAVDEQRALVAFETPHRLEDALADLLDGLGDRRVAVCRELTKVHEEVFRGTLSEAIAYFDSPRGEFTLVIEGANASDSAIPSVDPELLLRNLHGDGVSARESVSQAVEATGLGRRELYAIWLRISGDGSHG